MRLVLVRHGDAHAGFHGVIAGPRGCAGLTDLGRRQAAALRDRLATTGFHADAVVASVLPRAVETASIIAPALGFDTFEQDCDLCEVHTGEADALAWADYPARYGALDMVAEPDREFAPGGDSWNGFHDRVRRTLDRLAADHAGRTVVAFCHAGVITASMRIRFGLSGDGGDVRLVPTNTGLTTWDHDAEAGRWTLRAYDDAAHLDAGIPAAPEVGASRAPGGEGATP